MLYWKFSPNRIFYINEYWIFVPSALIANYFIIGKIRSDKARMKELKKLQEKIKQAERYRKILLLGLGLSATTNLYFIERGGGGEIIDTNYIRTKCYVEEGIRYLDDNRLGKIIHDLFKAKAKGKMIVITSTALCHVATNYGRQFLAFPVAIGDFGFTNAMQSFRKLSVTILFGAIGPLVTVGGTFYLSLALVAALSGFRLANINLDYIPTSPVDTNDIEPRVPGLPDVVVVNNRNKNKIVMTKHENKECWLPDQQLLNPNCRSIASETPIDVNLPDYEATVNMQDVTGLSQQQFTDRYDLEGTKAIKNSKIEIE